MDSSSERVFFNAIASRQNLINEFEALYAKKLATHFNVFNFVSWNENKVSEILAYFLDPNEGHAQGDVYLHCFLSTFDLNFNYLDLSKVKVRVEESTENRRRVDIVLSYDEREQVLGIENKLYAWTPDQKDQVKDYLQYLKTYCTTDVYQLVYLAPKLKVLSEYSAGPELENLIENRQLVILNYEEHFIKLIGDFIKQTENERVKYFLEDFKRKLIEMFFGNQNPDNKTMLTNFINENNENIKMAFAVANSLSSLKEQLKAELSEQMAEVARQLNVTYDRQYHHFELPNLKNCYVKYNYEEGGVIYGLVKKRFFHTAEPQKMPQPKLAALLGVKFKTSSWWPLYHLQYTNIEISDQLWLDIKSKKFSTFIKDFIEKVLLAPNDLIKDL